MSKQILYSLCALCVLLVFAGCNRPSKAEIYRAEKQKRDSVALVEQQRSMDYYQARLDSLQPQADSLLQYFNYERNERYQDRGFYVVRNTKLKVYGSSLRVLVRDDGKEILLYREGKRIEAEKLRKEEQVLLTTAQHLQIVIHDIQELEKRIRRTSLETEKYQKRLQK